MRRRYVKCPKCKDEDVLPHLRKGCDYCASHERYDAPVGHIAVPDTDRRGSSMDDNPRPGSPRPW